jgi:hypothetical protein
MFMTTTASAVGHGAMPETSKWLIGLKPTLLLNNEIE